jgi:hypothetical protein
MESDEYQAFVKGKGVATVLTAMRNQESVTPTLA